MSLPPLPLLSLDASDRLERAFAEAGVPLHVVRSRSDVPVPHRHTLFKLAGDLPTHSGIILSRAELRELGNDPDKRHLLAEARRLGAGGALLLLGCDPASEDFCAWWSALAPTFRGAALFAVGEPSAPWPAGVACLGPDLAAVVAALRAVPPPSPRPMPPAGATLTWLHLSDLHFRERHAWDEDIVLRALLRDVQERIEQDGLRPDFIVVTGDLAFSGQPEEYDLARQFFDELLAVAGLGKDRLFPVPGNHDVDRERISPGAAGMAASLADRRSVNEVLANDADRALLLARFAGYREFVNDYLGPHLAFDDARYFYVRTLDLAGRRTALLGLNSAWLARGGDEDRHKLALGERQVRAALDAAADADLRLALLHHPFDWLHDFDRADSEALLTDHCDFVLHGHMHQVGLLQARGPDSDAFIIAAGACYEDRERPDRPNSYNLVQLDFGAGRGAVHLRLYSDQRGGFWTRDVVNYRNVPEGMYRFSLGS